MNVKKILSMLLVVVMLFGLVACGNKEDGNTPTTNTEASVDTTPTEPAIDTEAMQKYYNTYFDGDDFKFIGESFVATSEGIELSLVNAKDGSGMFGMNMGTVKFEIYKTNEGEQYAHFVQSGTVNEDGSTASEAVDAWYHYDGTPAEGETEPEDVFASMSEDVTIEGLTDVQGEVVEVKYDKTENGIDYVKVYTNNPEYHPNKKLTNYEISFEIDGATYNAVCERVVDNEVDSTTVTNATLPDGWSMDSLYVDMANNKITNSINNKTVDITVEKETDVTPAQNVEIEFRVTHDTHEVVSVYGLENDLPTEIVFSNPDTVTFTVPETVEECDSETLAMLYLAVLFSAMG